MHHLREQVMSTSISFATLLGALVAASGYGSVAAAEPAPMAPRAIEQIRQARVELYCGHDAQGIAGIEAACRELRAAGGTSRMTALSALQQASFHARHHRAREAQEALERAVSELRA
jgi:Zn-dependent protease